MNKTVYIVKCFYENGADYYNEEYFLEVFSTKMKATQVFYEQVSKAKDEIVENFEIDKSEIVSSETELEDSISFQAEYDEVLYYIQLLTKSVN